MTLKDFYKVAFRNFIFVVDDNDNFICDYSGYDNELSTYPIKEITSKQTLCHGVVFRVKLVTK